MSTRRVRSAAEKRAVVAEADEPGATVSMVARRHNLHSSLLFRWRRDALAKAGAADVSSQPAFIPLALPAPIDPPQPTPVTGTIEIELIGGHRLRTEGHVDAAVLRGVIAALIGR